MVMLWLERSLLCFPATMTILWFGYGFIQAAVADQNPAY